jgi:hypothetical protein
VVFLADDARAGRLPGTAQSRAVADYIVQHLATAGCVPDGDDGSWYQEFTPYALTQFDPTAAVFEIVDHDAVWHSTDDWIPLAWSAPDDFEGAVLFVEARGGTLSTAELEYVADQVVCIVMAQDDASKIGDSLTDLFENAGNASTAHALVAQLAEHGAQAVLFAEPERSDATLVAFNPFLVKTPFALPVVHVSSRLTAALRTTPAPVVRVSLGVSKQPVTMRNIVGRLPATAASDRMIVIGAHYDHIGTHGRQERDVRNGANDNASGIATFLELADLLGRHDERRHDWVFVAFDGEEVGLLGSKHYVAHTEARLGDISAMINLDSIGRSYGRPLLVFGVESDPRFEPLVRTQARRRNIEIITGVDIPGYSDCTPFAEAGVPWLFPFTGLHPELHQAEDDWQLLDLNGMRAIGAWTYELVLAIDQAPAKRTTSDGAQSHPANDSRE